MPKKKKRKEADAVVCQKGNELCFGTNIFFLFNLVDSILANTL